MIYCNGIKSLANGLYKIKVSLFLKYELTDYFML